MKKNSKLFNFGDIIEGLYNYYKTTIVAKNKKYVYNGPNTTLSCILATSPSVKEQLSKEEITFRKREYNRHPVEILLTCAVQLGIEQGIRMCSEEPFQYLRNDVINIENIYNECPELAMKILRSKYIEEDIESDEE